MKLKIEGNLLEGVFVERLNRFIAHIEINNKIEKVHVANTGRMKELLIQGTKVIVRKVDNPNRKTKYDLLHVYKGDSLVFIDSKAPNIILERAFNERKLEGFRKKYDIIKREVKFGNSRFDLALSNKDEMVLVEAKCATLVKDNGIATFPDAPTERGTKHVLELIEAKKRGFRGAVFFIVQRDDAVIFTPNREMDSKFADAVKKAYKFGVEFYAYICEIKPHEMNIIRSIPVEIN